MKVRKKPEVCDADQWYPGKAVPGVVGYNNSKNANLSYSANGTTFVVPPGVAWTDCPKAGPQLVHEGDWVVCRLQSYQVYTSDSFNQTFDLVN